MTDTSRDKKAPVLVSTTLNDKRDLSIDANLTLTFNESIKTGVGNIQISTKDQTLTLPINSQQVKISGKKLTLNPVNDLLPSHSYVLKIPADAITDVAGNTFSKKTLAFDTQDTLNPVLKKITPANESSAVNVTKNIELTFNEKIQAGTGYFILSNGSDKRVISVKNAQVSVNEKTVVINPIKDLQPNSHYTLKVSSNAIKDLAGNKYVGGSFSFDTQDTLSPLLTNVQPEQDGKNVKVSSNIVFTFNEPVKTGTGFAILTSNSDERIVNITDKQFKFSGSNVTLNLSENLKPNSHYTVTIPATEIKDLAGNEIAAQTFSFDTIDTLKPILQTKPDAVGVKDNVVLSFNEPIQLGSGGISISSGKDTIKIDIKDTTQISVDGNNVILNLKNLLKSDAQYSVVIPSTAIKDLTGNRILKTDFTFKTLADEILKGKAIDGYLKGADVFADENGDGIWNEGEAKAVTDENGNFTLTNAKGTVVASGGIDLTTGKEFKGVLKAPEGATTVTPLTTLQQSFVEKGQSIEEAQKTVAKAFGFDAATIDLTKFDPIQELASGNGDKTVAAQIMATTAKVANFLVTATQTLQNATTNENTLSLNTASNVIIDALVKNIEQNITSNTSTDLADTDFVKTVLNDSANKIENIETTRIAKISEDFANVVTDSAKKIDASIQNTTADNALEVLTNIGKVSIFTQGTVAEKLVEAVANNSTLSDKQLGELTGDKAKTEIEKITVSVIAAEDAAKQKAAEDAAKQKAAEDAVKQKAAEDAAKQKAAEDAAKQKAAEDAVKQKAAEDAAKQKATEDAAKQKAAEDAAKQKAAEDAVKQKAAEDAAKQKAAEDAVKQKAAEDAAKQKATEDAVKQKAAEDAAKQKAAEEAAKQKAAEDAAKQKAAEEAAKQKAAEDAAKQKAAEDAVKQKAAEDAARQQALADETARQRAAEEESARQRAADEAAKQKALDDETARQKALAEEHDNAPISPPTQTPASPTFSVNVADGIVSWNGTTQGKVITFGGTATGNITMSVNANNVATFTRGGVTATTTVSDLLSQTVKKSILLNYDQTIELPQNQLLKQFEGVDYQLVRSGKTIINTAHFSGDANIDNLSHAAVDFYENGIKQTSIAIDKDVNFWIGSQINGLTFTGEGNVITPRGYGDNNYTFQVLTTGNNRINTSGGTDGITTGNGTNEITGGQNADLITLSVNGGTDTLIYRFSGTSYTPNNLSDSTTATFDTVKNFQVGTDKIWLALEGHNGTELVPESLTRFADVDGSSITSQNLLVSNVLKSQAFSNLPAKAAGIIVVNGGDFAGTYLYVNNSNAALQENDDLFIKFENIQNLGNVGTLTPLSYFRDYFPSNGGNNNSSGSNSNNNNAPAMQSIYTRDTNANGVLDAGDEIEFIFTEVVKASLLMNQNGSIVTNPVSQSGELVIMADGGATLGANPTIRANGLSNGYSGSYTITLGAGTTMAAGGKIKANLGHVEDIDGNHPTNDIEFILPALNGSSSNNSNVAEDALTEAARQQALADEAARQQALADEAARQQALADEAARQQALADEAARQQALADEAARQQALANIKSGSGTYSVQQFIASFNANTIATNDEIKIEDTSANIQSSLLTLIEHISLVDAITDTSFFNSSFSTNALFSSSVFLTKEQYQLLESVFIAGKSPVTIVANSNDNFTNIRLPYPYIFPNQNAYPAYQIAIPYGTNLKLTPEQAKYSYTYNQTIHNHYGDLTNAGNVIINNQNVYWSGDLDEIMGLGEGDKIELYGIGNSIEMTAEQNKLIVEMFGSSSLIKLTNSANDIIANPKITNYYLNYYDLNGNSTITLTSSGQSVRGDGTIIVNTGALTSLHGGIKADVLNINNSLNFDVYTTDISQKSLKKIQLAANVELQLTDFGFYGENFPYPSIFGVSNNESKESLIIDRWNPSALQNFINDVEIVKVLNLNYGNSPNNPTDINNGQYAKWLVYTDVDYLKYADNVVKTIQGFNQTKDRIVISDTLTQDTLHYSFNIGDAGAADTFIGAADFINANIDDFFWFGEDLEVGQDMYLAIADNDSWSVYRYLASTNNSYIDVTGEKRYWDSSGYTYNEANLPVVKPSELSLVVRVEGALNEAGVFPVDVGIDYHAPKQEDFIGTDGNDNLIGNEVDNYIEGGAGNDTLQGLEGDDILVGSYDQDDIDTAVYSGVSSDYLVEKQLDPDWQKPFYFVTDLNPDNGDEGWDILYSIENLQFSDKTISVEQAVFDSSSSVEDIFGTDGDDNLIGNSLDNYIDGSDGNDTLTGLEGDDILIGDVGIDVAVYRGNVEDYTIEEFDDVVYVIDNNLTDGDDGIDALYSIEYLQFSNNPSYELLTMSSYYNELFSLLPL